MNTSEYSTAGQGLNLIFWGQIVGVISAVAVFFSVALGAICSIAGLVLIIVGLAKAASVHPVYRTGLYMAVASIVVSILRAFFSTGLFNSILVLISLILTYLIVSSVCNASESMLREKGDDTQADKARQVAKLYLICTVTAVVCSVLAIIPIINLLAGVVSIVMAIVQLVASILYLIFLYNGSQSLRS